MNIDDTLAERGNRYGVFAEHARITPAIIEKAAMADSPNWATLAPDMLEALVRLSAERERRISEAKASAWEWYIAACYRIVRP